MLHFLAFSFILMELYPSMNLLYYMRAYPCVIMIYIMCNIWQISLQVPHTPIYQLWSQYYILMHNSWEKKKVHSTNLDHTFNNSLKSALAATSLSFRYSRNSRSHFLSEEENLVYRGSSFNSFFKSFQLESRWSSGSSSSSSLRI